jgi:hypothetical protein
MADLITSTNTSMPDWVTPYASGYLNRAQQVADQPYQQYNGQRVAGFNPYQTQAYDAQAQRAMQGSPTMGAANSNIQGVLGGDYLQGNPYLTQQIDAAQGDVIRNWNNVQKPQWDTAMQNSGSFGNSGVAMANQNAQSDMQRNLGNISSTMRYNNYAGERANQMSALGLAPGFAQQDYNDINQLANAGTAYQTQNQKALDADYTQFLDQRQYPQQQLDTMGTALQRSYGQNTTTSQPGASTASQLFGGAVTGAGLYNLLFGKP